MRRLRQALGFLRREPWPERLEPQARALIHAVYHQLLGREPDAEGVEHWLGWLRQGGSFDGLLEAFLQSSEYQERTGRMERLPPRDRERFKAVDLRQAQRAYLRGLRYGREYPAAPAAPRAPGPANPLEAWFDAHREGPGIWKWRHYFDAYHRHLARFVDRPVHVLEVGIFSGGSLQLWQDYFGPGCRVYGVDIDPRCRAYESERVRVFIGDQADRAFWRQVRAEVPVVDIVIDDGGHETGQQIVTLEEMLPHLRPGGLYAVEDLYRESNAFHDYLSGLTRSLSEMGPPKPGSADVHEGAVTNGLQRAVQSVHQYPFLALIERSTTPASALVAPRHGTQWQPFR